MTSFDLVKSVGNLALVDYNQWDYNLFSQRSGDGQRSGRLQSMRLQSVWSTLWSTVNTQQILVYVLYGSLSMFSQVSVIRKPIKFYVEEFNSASSPLYWTKPESGEQWSSVTKNTEVYLRLLEVFKRPHWWSFLMYEVSLAKGNVNG